MGVRSLSYKLVSGKAKTMPLSLQLVISLSALWCSLCHVSNKDYNRDHSLWALLSSDIA